MTPLSEIMVSPADVNYYEQKQGYCESFGADMIMKSKAQVLDKLDKIQDSYEGVKNKVFISPNEKCIKFSIKG